MPGTLAVRCEGALIPVARQGFFSTTPDGAIEEVWTSPTDHTVVFSDPDAQQRFDEIDAAVARLDARVPPYPENAWLTPQFSRSSKLFPSLLLRFGVGLVGLLWRRPAEKGLAALALAALLVVSFQALAVNPIIEFAVPVAPHL